MDGVGRRLDLEHRAEALALRFGGPPCDLDAIAQAVGIIQVTVEDIDAAALLHVGPLIGTWGVVLRRQGAFVRRRFSMAHEIAHVALGFVGSERKYMGEVAARSSRDPAERSCDYFAACLLMPRAWVNAEVARGTTVGTMARRLDVSQDAMRLRLHELGHNALAK